MSDAMGLRDLRYFAQILARLGFRPCLGCQILHLPVGRRWQPGEDVPQIGERIDATAAAVLNYRVDDRTPVTRGSFAHEQPVLFADSRGADRVLDQVVVYFE